MAEAFTPTNSMREYVVPGLAARCRDRKSPHRVTCACSRATVSQSFGDLLDCGFLTKLYNRRPPWLAACHARLDAAVAAAYGWAPDLPDDAILERLLALNHARAK